MNHPILRYYGGKARIAEWVVSHLPPHRVYVEPFGGAGSVLLCKDREGLEIYNDIDGQVVNVLRMIRDRKDDLKDYMRAFPYSRDEFYRIINSETQPDCPVSRVCETIFRAHAGYGASGLRKRNTGFRGAFTSGSLDTMRSVLGRWRAYPDRLEHFTSRLSGVLLENLCAFDLIEKMDRPGTLFYLDPPYEFGLRTGDKNTYRHEMTDADHDSLAGIAARLKGMVVISGYEGGRYDMLGWRKVTRRTKTLYNGDRTEALWLNPACRRPIGGLFSDTEAPQRKEKPIYEA